MSSQLEDKAPIKPVLQLTKVNKSYPGVQALKDVSLSLMPGTVHALLGENGAGKSTLIRMISGVERPDSGTYQLNGRPADIQYPRQATECGISVVHQERNLVSTFTVGENVLLDRVIGGGDKIINQRMIHSDAIPFMEMVGLKVSPEQSVQNLSAAQQQLIEIARALSTNAKILLLDEPTASISLKEASALIKIIRKLQKDGTSVIYVSHKLEEVFEVCDTVTVLRDGQNAGDSLSVSNLCRDDLISLMVGRTFAADALPVRESNEDQPVLEVIDKPSMATVQGSSFVLHKGEILGWYGLVGSGRSELARSIIGADIVPGGTVKLNGNTVRIKSISDALHRWRIGYVSEDRQHEGLFLIHSIQRNIAAPIWKRLRTKAHLLLNRDEKQLAEKYKSSLDISAPTVETLVASLSGGNKQKVCLGKWLATGPNILFVDEPTVGIDVRTKHDIHNLVFNLGETGTSVVLISSDMPEIIGLADRIIVFDGGVIVGEIQNNKNYDDISHQIMAMIMNSEIDDESSEMRELESANE